LLVVFDEMLLLWLALASNILNKGYKMSVSIKTESELECMRRSGQMAADVLEMIAPYVVPGVTTEELNERCHDYIVNTQKAVPAPLNYHGFPKSICTSVNHVVCHGIPGPKVLKDGDIINIDVTVLHDDFHGDTSKMFVVGSVGAQVKRLIRVTQEAMYTGINMVKPGVRLGDIGAAIQRYVEKNRFSVVREYCGHGIGRVFHEPEIQVLHYGRPGTGLELEAGMTLTIEPMVNAGKRHVKLLDDDWTVITKDRSLSAQWEHTLAVTDTGYEIFTLRPDESLDHIASF